MYMTMLLELYFFFEFVCSYVNTPWAVVWNLRYINVCYYYNNRHMLHQCITKETGKILSLKKNICKFYVYEMATFDPYSFTSGKLLAEGK